MNFGIPYMGSKSGIASVICRSIPSAENLYDLFGGGFCVTHCMLSMRPEKYRRYFFNEIEADTVGLIKRAISGEFNYEKFKPPFISHVEFMARKDSCAYTRLLWSFGNNQKCYLFGEDIEPKKKSLHNAVVFNQFDDFAIMAIGIPKFVERWTITQRRLYARGATVRRMGELQRLQQLERLEQLEQLERLEQLQQLEMSSLDYAEVPILPNSVVYCDPPYAGTAKYTRPFDHARFWNWAALLPHPVFISEYQAPAEFRVALSIEKKSRLSGVGMKATKNEMLFVNGAGAELLESLGRKTFNNLGVRTAAQ